MKKEAYSKSWKRKNWEKILSQTSNDITQWKQTTDSFSLSSFWVAIILRVKSIFNFLEMRLACIFKSCLTFPFECNYLALVEKSDDGHCREAYRTKQVNTSAFKTAWYFTPCRMPDAGFSDELDKTDAVHGATLWRSWGYLSVVQRTAVFAVKQYTSVFVEKWKV